MFAYADKDKDGKINWLEFQTMINPTQSSAQWTEDFVDKAATERSETVKTVTDIKVSFHPQTLSVRGILKQSDSVRNNRIAPLEFSDTHISASWTEIGLQEPAKNTEKVTRFIYQ